MDVEEDDSIELLAATASLSPILDAVLVNQDGATVI